MTAKPLTKNERDILAPFAAFPHPDGQPWDKCCGTKGEITCQCFARKPKNGPSRLDEHLEPHPYNGVGMVIYAGGALALTVKSTLAEGGRFFCMHRTDDNYHRECAGWAARKVKP